MVSEAMLPRAAVREVEQRLTAAGCPDADFDARELFRLATGRDVRLSDRPLTAEQAAALEALTAGEKGFTVLLSHRPERLALYAEYGADLVFSGHAHGGQVRLPIVGGLIAPNQGILPAYDEGLYRMGETAMLVSRGVGNSILPLRINNRPEILVAELKISVGFSE